MSDIVSSSVEAMKTPDTTSFKVEPWKPFIRPVSAEMMSKTFILLYVERKREFSEKDANFKNFRKFLWNLWIVTLTVRHLVSDNNKNRF